MKVCARDTAPSRGRAGAPVSRLERASLPNDSFSDVRRVLSKLLSGRTLLADSDLLAVSYLLAVTYRSSQAWQKTTTSLPHVTFVG